VTALRKHTLLPEQDMWDTQTTTGSPMISYANVLTSANTYNAAELTRGSVR
jgi:hypothetical protein